ncbi:MAG: ABC transporter ATP-binding protein [Sulfurimonas sp.]|nr:ABC transporter ATP-binding protein [Sulfurimonas sp.]
MLSLKNISKKFGDSIVLHSLDLEIKKGEIISLLGQSGSGKSTILNLIAGFEEADSGTFVYQGKTLFDTDTFCEPQKRNIGFVFQNYALFPHLSVAKNITFGISNKPKEYQKTTLNTLLTLINMQGMESKLPHQLSGGQQQRVAIARVLARQSELILFDEPFSSIDATLKSKLIKEIKDIIKSLNKTAIFVTHCPKEAILLSDKIGYIQNGKIIQFDTPANLFKNPASKTIADIFAQESFIFKSVQDLIGNFN